MLLSVIAHTTIATYTQENGCRAVEMTSRDDTHHDLIRLSYYSVTSGTTRQSSRCIGNCLWHPSIYLHIVTMHSSTAQHNTRTRATVTARPLLTSGTIAGLRLCHRDCIRGSQMSVSTPASLLLRLHSCVATCRSRRRATAARTVAEATVSRPGSGGGHRQPTGQWRRPPSADRR